jgi:hypothetical protein
MRIDREWLSLSQLTAYADVSERTLRCRIRHPIGPLPAVQVGGKILVRRAGFDAWLQRNRVQANDSVDIHGIVDDLMGGLS